MEDDGTCLGGQGGGWGQNLRASLSGYGGQMNNIYWN